MSFLSILAVFVRAAGGFPVAPAKKREKTADAERMCFTMKSTGIVRRVDELGRIVLPIELRRTLNIAEKDSLEIYVDGSSIMLSPPAFSAIVQRISLSLRARISAHTVSRSCYKNNPALSNQQGRVPYVGTRPFPCSSRRPNPRGYVGVSKRPQPPAGAAAAVVQIKILSFGQAHGHRALSGRAGRLLPPL